MTLTELETERRENNNLMLTMINGIKEDQDKFIEKSNLDHDGINKTLVGFAKDLKYNNEILTIRVKANESRIQHVAEISKKTAIEFAAIKNQAKGAVFTASTIKKFIIWAIPTIAGIYTFLKALKIF